MKQMEEGKEKSVEVTLERGMKDGKRFFRIFLNGVRTDDFLASRKLTGTSYETNAGVFTFPLQDDTQHITRVDFWSGNQHESFEFGRKGLMTAPLYVLASEIEARVRTVREWIATYGYEERYSFKV